MFPTFGIRGGRCACVGEHIDYSGADGEVLGSCVEGSYERWKCGVQATERGEQKLEEGLPRYGAHEKKG